MTGMMEAEGDEEGGNEGGGGDVVERGSRCSVAHSEGTEVTSRG
jgi:hypothetical protein